MTVSLIDLPGARVGQVTDALALTGCTVVVFLEGAIVAHQILGVATGSRELAALDPRHSVERVHAICLAGGSAFGLAAAGGAARVLEARGIGHQTPFACVPIVAGAVVYDLALGDARERPDEAMGARAAEEALAGAPGAVPLSGNVGAGTGVCAGKVLGVPCATKTGLGHGGVRCDDGLITAALAVVNPVGDVVDLDGRILAGARRSPESRELVGSASLVRAGRVRAPLTPAPNTTLAVVATNAALTRVEAAWVAEQAGVALARLIDPPFTRHDGDLVFCASVGEHQADLHRVGLLCRDALVSAILDACLSAEPAGGLPSGHGLLQP